jgi:tRNA threonylcarbamoyladenosine biosynthesis protein TsaB
MIVLGIDSTQGRLEMALARDSETILEEEFPADLELSAVMIGHLDAVLEKAGIVLADIGLLGIAIGPGKFTAIRVALSTVKGLFFGSGTMIVPVVSNLALARAAASGQGLICTLGDAGRGEIYCALYRDLPGELITLRQPFLARISELPELLSSQAGLPLSFVGSAVTKHHDFLRSSFAQSTIFEHLPPTARTIIGIARERQAGGDYLRDLEMLLPFYIRPPDAEQKSR